MRIVALEAISNCGRMNLPLDLFWVFFGVAGKAESLRSGSRQLDAGDVFIHPDFVASRASGRDGGVYGGPFGLVLMTLDAFGWVGVFVERNRVLARV